MPNRVREGRRTPREYARRIRAGRAATKANVPGRPRVGSKFPNNFAKNLQNSCHFFRARLESVNRGTSRLEIGRPILFVALWALKRGLALATPCECKARGLSLATGIVRICPTREMRHGLRNSPCLRSGCAL
jgi:hypothetical protein